MRHNGFMQFVLTPELILEAYAQGLFPMAYHAESPHIHWICPEERGQLSITDIHFPKRLMKTVRKMPYEVTVDNDFAGVITMCAAHTHERPETWINDSIRDVFIKLHKMGHAHSVEAWLDGQLVGGVYGLKIGSAFFGESMFSRANDASKVTLVHLVARLWRGGFTLLDTQFVNDHLEQFGIYEVPHDDYKAQLDIAVGIDADFSLKGTDMRESDLVDAYFKMRQDAR